MTDHTLPRPPLSGWKKDLVLFIDRQVLALAKHWLATFNLLVGMYTLLPILAPILMANGAPQIGKWIYVLYSPACHQLPHRSFFLFGPQATYSIQELWALNLLPDTKLLTLKQFLGTPQIGFKIAICQRDIALYGGLFVGGLAFALLRKRLKPLSLLLYGLCLLPMVIDGGTQLIGLRESSWLTRTITGGLVGLASVWMLYPHVEMAFAEIRWRAQYQVDKE